MRTQQLGATDLDLTVLGFGAWAIGGAGWTLGWGPQDERDSVAAIERALEAGINWIDTAPIYGRGRSEAVIGKAIAGLKADGVVRAIGASNFTIEQLRRAQAIAPVDALQPPYSPSPGLCAGPR